MAFSIGQLVCLKADPSRQGPVIEVLPPAAGRIRYRVFHSPVEIREYYEDQLEGLGAAKYVVDTCIINWLVDGLLAESDLPGDGDYVATHIQRDELARTRDPVRREALLDKFSDLIGEHMPTSSTVIGVSRLGECRLGTSGYCDAVKAALNSINHGRANNLLDALIAEVAIVHGYTLLTTDQDLARAAESSGCAVRCWKKS